MSGDEVAYREAQKMTWGELAEFVNKLTEDQKKETIIIHDSSPDGSNMVDNYYWVYAAKIAAGEQNVVDTGVPYLVISDEIG